MPNVPEKVVALHDEFAVKKYIVNAYLIEIRLNELRQENQTDKKRQRKE